MKLSNFYQNLPVDTVVQFRYREEGISIRKVTVSNPERLEFETLSGTTVGLVTEITPNEISIETHGSWYAFYYKQRILLSMRVLTQRELQNIKDLSSYSSVTEVPVEGSNRGYPSVRSFQKSHLTLVK